MALGTPVVGTSVYSGVGNALAPVAPSGVNNNDALILVIGQKPSTANGGTVTTPTGWTLRVSNLAQGGYGTTTGADVGNTNLRIYTKDVVTTADAGATTNVTLAGTNSSFGFIIRVPSSTGQISYGAADGSQGSTPTSPLSVTLGSDPGFTAGDIALWAMCIPTDLNSPDPFVSHSATASGVTFGTATELNAPNTTINNDCGGFSAWASISSGTSSGAPTVSATLTGTLTNIRGPLSMIRVREAAPLIVSESNVRVTSQTMAVTADAQLAISQSNVQLTSEPMAIEAEQPVAEGGHYGAYWLKKWEETRKNLSKKITQKEVLDLVQEQPEQALEVVKEKVKAKFPEVDLEAAKTNIKIQRYIAKQIIIEIQLRKAEMDEEDDLETILMLI